MKKITLLLLFFCCNSIYSQVNPTLGIGLETLTLNKGTIDVEVLTQVILKKQKELKNEALKRFMLKMFPDTNYTTRFYVQNCLNILLNEKNPQVIEKEILELTTNYAIALGVTKAVIELDESIFDSSTPKSNSEIDYKKILNNLKYQSDIASITTKIEKITVQNEKIIQLQKDKDSLSKISAYVDAIKDYEKDIKKIKRKLARKGVPFSLLDSKYITIDKNNPLNFGERLDLVSLALSDNDLLRKKGFFKNRIDYREDQGYFFSNESDSIILEKINEKIKIYVENYDVIKTFLKDAKNLTTDNIAEELSGIYFKQLELKNEFGDIINNKAFVLDSRNEIDLLNNYYALKNEIRVFNETKKNQLKKISIPEIVNESTLKEINTLAKDLSIKEKSIHENISRINLISKNLKLKTIEKITIVKEPTTIKHFFKNEKLSVESDLKKIDSIRNINQSINKDSLINLIVSEYKINPKINELTNNINSYLSIDYTTIDTELNDLIDISKNKILKSPVFVNVYLNKLIEKFENSDTYNSQAKIGKENNDDEISKLFSEIYQKLQLFKNDKNYSISEINDLETNLLSRLVGLKYTEAKENIVFYNSLITSIKNLTPLLKIKLLYEKQLTIKYNEKLISLFEFIGNLDKLDKAQTYSNIVDLIKKNSEEITKILPDGEFKEGYMLFINGIKKYTLISTNEANEYVEIDVVSFLNDLQQHYQRNNPSTFSLYLTLGLNQNMFINKFQFSDTDESLTSIGFASEKIGVKLKILDFKKHRGYENAIKSDIYLNKRAPFINEWYAAVYGSGLLYSLANTTTNQNFNFPHVGFATGFRFYNALDVNLMLGLPFIKDQKFGNNGFIGVGFDIPLGEYLEALGNK